MADPLGLDQLHRVRTHEHICSSVPSSLSAPAVRATHAVNLVELYLLTLILARPSRFSSRLLVAPAWEEITYGIMKCASMSWRHEARDAAKPTTLPLLLPSLLSHPLRFCLHTHTYIRYLYKKPERGENEEGEREGMR